MFLKMLLEVVKNNDVVIFHNRKIQFTETADVQNNHVVIFHKMFLRNVFEMFKITICDRFLI